jgi:phage-related protein
MDEDEDIREIPLRPLVWMRDSLKNIHSFPEEVRASVGYRRTLKAQKSKKPTLQAVPL